MARKLLVLVALLAVPVLGVDTGVASADPVVLSVEATAGANGTTLAVSAPGCQPTPPASSSEIVLQTRNRTTGEIGEGAVAVGGFTAPGQGSVVIPAGTPGDSFLLTVTCNAGVLTGTQELVLAFPATPVRSQPNFTG